MNQSSKRTRVKFVGDSKLARIQVLLNENGQYIEEIVELNE